MGVGPTGRTDPARRTAGSVGGAARHEPPSGAAGLPG